MSENVIEDTWRQKKIYIIYNESMQLVTVCTTLNEWSQEWEATAKDQGYDYRLLGVGTEWKGFGTLIQIMVDHLSSLDAGTLVAKVDCYDVVLAAPPEELVHKFLSYNASLVFGGERQCAKGMNCEPTAPERCQLSKDQKNRYVNGGFVMGKAKDLLRVYRFMQDKGYDDDQLGLANYWMLHCGHVHLDDDQSLVANVWSSKDLQWNESKQRFQVKYSGAYPVVIHTPNMFIDLGRRVNQVRSKLVPDFTPRSKWSYIRELTNHLRKCMWYPVYLKWWLPILIGLVLLIVVILVLAKRTK